MKLLSTTLISGYGKKTLVICGLALGFSPFVVTKALAGQRFVVDFQTDRAGQDIM